MNNQIFVSLQACYISNLKLRDIASLKDQSEITNKHFTIKIILYIIMIRIKWSSKSQNYHFKKQGSLNFLAKTILLRVQQKERTPKKSLHKR